MNIRSILSAAATSLAGLALCSAAVTGVSSAHAPDPAGTPTVLTAGHTTPIAGAVASGSSKRSEPGFDPGPYSSWEACEDARSRYYDPDQLECVPA
ncbi:hypothetical protein [Nocardia sp. BMG51109]|uniref:hypothetical protein n=1 Tax=Nocardia sp. BMG51109 TaxID=1056816 RepID=UPI000467E72F|nr:hypothetical protein [Nocardia sp. BMG51109]